MTSQENPNKAPGVVSGRRKPSREPIEWSAEWHQIRESQGWFLANVKGPRILVIGCGTGALVFALARQGFIVKGVDAVATNIARAQKALLSRPSSVRDRVSFECLDPVAQPIADPEPFDSVVLDSVLHTCPDPATTLRAAAGCLKQGGNLVVTIPLGRIDDDRQTSVFRIRGFVQMMESVCRPVHLSMQGVTVRFVGQLEAEGNTGSGIVAAERLLDFVDDVLTAEQERYAGLINDLREQVRVAEEQLRALRATTSYQVGHLIVQAAREPSQIWRLPARLLQVYRSRRSARANARLLRPAQRVDFPPFPVPGPPPATKLRIAAILDTFTEFCLRHEAELVLLTRYEWKRQMELHRPDFLFVESAWHGNGGEWTRAISDFGSIPQNPVGELLDYCRKEGIPTVFWNKEDPPHFARFIEIARWFDVIFTTDADCVPLYRERCGHERVYPLPFAAEPRVHNPMRRKEWPRHNVCFAGSWIEGRYAERRQRLANLLDAAMGYDLHIFDRHQAREHRMYRYPDRYQPFLKGTLSYDRMLTAYRCYRVMLNANTVEGSPTMFSRRVFESLACGTPVVSTESTGMAAMLGQHVHVAGTVEEARQHLERLLGDEEYRLRHGHAAYRYVHTQHSWRHRLGEVASRIGLPPLPDPCDATVSVVMCTMRPENVERCLEAFQRQKHPRKELLLVLNNGVFDVEGIRRRVAAIPDARVLHVEGATTLGECLNLAIGQASGEFIAKMDDDDYYGEHYLSDEVLAASWSGADIVGKGTYFTYLEGQNLLGVRNLAPEHAFTRLVSGATLLVRRSVFRDVRFQAIRRGTDTAFLVDALNNDCSIYSTDRFNFILVRKGDTSGHTWQVPEEKFISKCQDLRPGLDLARVMV